MKFIIHDIENFPFVEFKQDQAVPGYSPQWQLEMQEFLEMSSPFVIVYDQLSMQETPEDYKQRGLWLKNHKDELNQLCKAIICIEPDQEKRVAIRKMTEMAVKAFGIPYEIVNTREDAERIVDELIQV